jgi:hypothetical protein
MSLTDFKSKMNKSKINKYKINNNNKTNTKHEFNVKYERYIHLEFRQYKCAEVCRDTFVSTN